MTPINYFPTGERRATSTIGLITPTYWRDFELCGLLCESIDRYLSSYVKHYLIVADDELPLFDRFNGHRRVVVPSSQLLPPWLKPLPRFVQRRHPQYWWSLRAAPVRGQRVQQILKLAAASTFLEERCCMLDANIVFFRPFDLSMMLRPRLAPLFVPDEISTNTPRNARLVRTSHRLLGLNAPALPAAVFSSPIAIADQRTVRAMIERIEAVTGMEWVEALCRPRDVSWSMLYGCFVQNDPRHRAEHFSTARTRCLDDRDALDQMSIETILRSADDDHVAFSTAVAETDLIRAALARFTEAQKQVA